MSVSTSFFSIFLTPSFSHAIPTSSRQWPVCPWKGGSQRRAFRRLMCFGSSRSQGSQKEFFLFRFSCWFWLGIPVVFAEGSCTIRRCFIDRFCIRMCLAVYPLIRFVVLWGWGGVRRRGWIASLLLTSVIYKYYKGEVGRWMWMGWYDEYNLGVIWISLPWERGPWWYMCRGWFYSRLIFWFIPSAGRRKWA